MRRVWKTPGRGNLELLNGASSIWAWGVWETPGRGNPELLNGASSIWMWSDQRERLGVQALADGGHERLRGNYVLQWSEIEGLGVGVPAAPAEAVRGHDVG